MSHAGLVLLRQLADRAGLTAGLSVALPSPLGGHDRGRVLSDLACAIADGVRVISDFRVMGDQRELPGPVASVPTAWRALKETAAGGDRRRRKITAAVSKARRHAWAHGIACHGGLPPVRVADRRLEGVTCIRLDATVVTAHSDKELAEPNFKGYGHHPVIAACDNTGEPLAWMLRPGSAGSNTAADHLRLLADAITALPPALRRKLMITCDGAGASHALVKELDRLASRHGYQVTWSVGWELAARERAAIGKVPEPAWEAAIDGRGEVRERRADDACGNQRCAHRECWIEEAHVAELTGLLREGPAAGLTPAQRQRWDQPTNLPPSLLPSAQCVHELAPALCDLLPLPGLRFRHPRRRLSERCWRLVRRGGHLSLTLVLPIGVVLGRGHDPETTKSPWLERVTGIEPALSAWESERCNRLTSPTCGASWP